MKAFIFILLLLQSSLAFANTSGFGTRIFFGNGMFNSYEEAIVSKKSLKKLDIGVLSKDSNLDFSFASKDQKRASGP